MIETLSILPLFISMLLSHAADGLWIACDLRGLFDRPIRKQGIEVLGRDAADFVHAAHPRHDVLFLEVLELVRCPLLWQAQRRHRGSTARDWSCNLRR